MEAGNFRSLGVENSRGRVASEICKQTSKVRSADNKFVKYCTYVKYFRRELVPPGQEGQGFYSTFFIVPKKDGGLRPILNLKPLNVYMEKSHFKMETLRSIIQALHVGEWGSTLDLRDAYLQIPMFPPHRKYLRFCVQGVHYQFRAMPFGITVAPRVFTKLMAAVGGHLRSQQIHIFMYLDDWLVKNQIRELLLHQLNQTIQLLVDLGLIINLDKCHLVPSQIITYLGAVFNLNKGLVLPSENSFLAIKQAIADIIYNRQCPASHFLRLLGLMASCIDTVPYGRLHMRPIQIYLLYFWRPHIDGLHFKIPVFPILATHLMWWQQERNIFRGVPLQGYPHNKVLWTDASKWGWGAHLGTHQVAGQWPKELINHHINWLEMRAVWNALIEFQEEIQGENLLIRCDNATVVAYINKQGGTKSIPLCLLLWDIMQWCLKHNIHIHAAHIPGKKNCLADKLSRGQKLVRLTEWALKPSIVQHIFQIMGTPNIDLFATRANSQLPVFCSPCPDPLAWTCDALSELGGDVCICISSPHTHSQSLNESQTRELLNSSGSALSSTSVLVSSTSGVNSGCSSKTTSITRPVVSEQRSVITSKSKKSKSGSVENICRSKSSKQFSSKASKYMEQSIRSSTRRLYSVRWEIFSSWCAERQISPTSASVGNVADFFVYLHSVKKCKVATIIGYRSAISSKHKGWGGRSVSTNGDLSKLIKGIFNSNPRGSFRRWVNVIFN